MSIWVITKKPMINYLSFYDSTSIKYVILDINISLNQLISKDIEIVKKYSPNK